MKTLDQKDEDVEKYRKDFAGTQADQNTRAAEAVAGKLKKTKLSGDLFHLFLMRV